MKKQKHKSGHHHDSWVPIWFVEEKDFFGDPIWVFRGDYWEIRKEKEENKDNKELFLHPSVKGSAADFASYFVNWQGLLGQETEDNKETKEKAEKNEEAPKRKSRQKVVCLLSVVHVLFEIIRYVDTFFSLSS